MSLESLVNGIATALSEKGTMAAAYTWEPQLLGNEFPLLAVRYMNDLSVGGSNEEFLPSRITFQCRIYYPIFDQGEGSEDGLKLAQEACLKADSSFRSALADDPSLEGQAMQSQILNARAYGLQDPEVGNLYVHELNVEVYVH